MFCLAVKSVAPGRMRTGKKREGRATSPDGGGKAAEMMPKNVQRAGSRERQKFDAADFMRKLMPQPRRGAPPAPLAWVPALLPGLAKNRRIDRPMPRTLGRMGHLEVRLARGHAEICKAQALRYTVFYEE